MKIFKISSRQDWQIYIEEFKNELKEKDISKKEKNIRNKFFNYIKAKNIKNLFFHGTSEVLYQKMKENGYMISPEYLNTTQYEKRNQGLDKIFFTKDIEYAGHYEQRAEEETNSKGIILTLEIPIYRISEIQAAIFDSYTYNESEGLFETGKVIQNYIPNLINDFDKYKDELIDEIIKIINDSGYEEFTVYGKIKVNPTKSGFQYIKKIDEIEKDKWIEYVENNKIDIEDIPSYIKETISKNQWIEWIKNDKVDIRNGYIFASMFDKNDWINFIKMGKIKDIRNIHYTIKNKITNDDLRNIIEEVDEYDFNIIIPAKRYDKFESNEIFKWIEKGKINFINIPEDIFEKISDYQWGEWIESDENKMTFMNIPKEYHNDILNKHPHDKWIEWIKEHKISAAEREISQIYENLSFQDWKDFINNEVIGLKFIINYMPKEFKDKININKWIELIDKEILFLKNIPMNIREKIDFDKFIEWIKKGKIRVENMPLKIMKEIHPNKWFDFIMKGFIRYQINSFPTNVIESFDGEQWVEMAEKKLISYFEIPEEKYSEIPTDILENWIDNCFINPDKISIEKRLEFNINKLIEWIKFNTCHINIKYIPKEKLNEINKDQWIDLIETNKENTSFHGLERVPQNILKNINIEKWIEWLVSKDIESTYVLYYMPKEKKEEINIEQWTKIYLKNGPDTIIFKHIPKEKINDYFINEVIKYIESYKKILIVPDEIKKYITEDKWMEWIEKEKIQISNPDIPDYIIKKIDQQKESMNWFKIIKIAQNNIKY